MSTVNTKEIKYSEGSVPLCVDLDGTLVKTDLLLESVLLLLKSNPLYCFLLPLWLLKGKAYLKQQVARRVDIDVACLPYDPEFLAFLKEQSKSGRRLVLATATDIRIARQIADYLGLFDEVLASDGINNVSGSKKLELIQRKFGHNGFDYAANADVDLPIWKHSNGAILVNANTRLVRKVEKIASISKAFERQQKLMRAFLKAIRPHQWVKNLLIFVPIVTSHQITNVHLVLSGIYAFLAFCLCNSGVYLFNDLLDLESDRHHQSKKHRPFAKGDLSLRSGLLIIPLFMIISFAVARLLPIRFLLVLTSYFVMTVLYSVYLKQMVLLDVILLALLYIIRIIAGSAATHIYPSTWLLAFSMFFFLSLAFLKRFVELHELNRQDRDSAKGRGYFASDMTQIAILGSSAGHISVLVLALYINSENVVVLYSNPALLWLLCPLMLYWISRIWLIAHRGSMSQDPIIFALKDRVSYYVGFLVALIILAAAIGEGSIFRLFS